MELSIRPIAESDTAQLQELVKDSYAEAADALWFPAEPDEKALTETFKAKLEAVGKGMLIDNVLVANGKLVGDCEIAKQEGIGLVGILIAKQYRSNEIGRKLLLHCMKEAYAAGLRSVIAEVANSNAAACRFFLKNGFMLMSPEPTVLEKNGKEVTAVRLIFRF